jgi:NADPH2:quinone reductase
MKAIRVHEFGDPEVMQLEEVPKIQLGPGQVLIKARATPALPSLVSGSVGNGP